MLLENPGQILCGSIGEGTATGLTRGYQLPLEDSDVLMVKGRIALNDIHTLGIHDGFLNICDSRDTSKVSYVRKDKFLDITIEERDEGISKLRLEFHGEAIKVTTGPALNETFRGANANISYDNVPALECKDGWPMQAERWRLRKRISGWPSLVLTDFVTQKAFHVVPVSHPKSKNPVIEWRFSFSLAEKYLMLSLSKWQKNCYMLTKIICKKAFQGFKLLCSYHIKTMILWMLEEYSAEFFREDTICAMVILLLERLILQFSRKRIPNYFIETCNLIDCMQREHVLACVRILSAVRNNPMYYLMETLKEHFVIRGRGSIYEQLKTPTKCFTYFSRTSILFKMLRGIAYDLQRRIKCYQFMISPLNYKPILEIICKMTHLQYQEIGLKWVCPDLLNEDFTIGLNEYQHDLTICLSSMYCALGSHLRVKFSNSEGSTREQFFVKTNKFFGAALADVTETYGSIYAEYAAFLIDCGDLERAKWMIERSKSSQNEVYNHFISGHGYFRVKSLYFVLLLEMELALRLKQDNKRIVNQYEARLLTDGIGLHDEISCEMSGSHKMKDLIQAIEQRGDMDYYDSCTRQRIDALKKLILGHHGENARLIYGILKERSTFGDENEN